jgi:hypothetical protein
MNPYRKIKLLFVGILLTIASNCSPFEPGYQEMERFTSPDGIVDAVWLRGNGGATTGYWFRLFLVPKGIIFDKDATSFENPVFEGDHLEALEVVWKQPKLLELHFKHARISRYSNYWRGPYVVETILVHEGDGSTLGDEDRR